MFSGRVVREIGERPYRRYNPENRGTDGERDPWLRLTNQGYAIEENDRGFGIRLNIKPYAAEWFGIDTSDPYAVERLERVVAGEVEGVVMSSGREFRHYRNHLDRKITQLQQRGDLRGVRACKDERARYTDHVTHAASREIVDSAREHAPCAITVEDLSGYRESVEDPDHRPPCGSNCAGRHAERQDTTLGVRRRDEPGILVAESDGSPLVATLAL